MRLSGVRPEVYCAERNNSGDCFITVRLLPQRVENSPVVPDPEQLIWGCYPVRVGVLGIPEDGVREPNQADHIADGERERRYS